MIEDDNPEQRIERRATAGDQYLDASVLEKLRERGFDFDGPPVLS